MDNVYGYEGNVFPVFVKLAFPNFAYIVTKDAFSLVNGKHLDLSVSSLNSLASTPNSGKKKKKLIPMVGVECLRLSPLIYFEWC